MNWDDLRLFDAAFECNSLSLAARTLSMSQPQLSRRLRGFEESLGVRLFDRTPQGLRPTAAARRLAPLAAAMRDAAEAVERARPDLQADMLATVRISVDEVRGRFLTDNLMTLQRMLEGIELEIVTTQSHADHEARETEIQLRACLPESETLIVKRLGKVTYAVYGGRGYVHKNPAALGEARYHDCAWIGFSPERLWYTEQHHWLEQRLERRPGLRFNSMTAIEDALAADLGLALLPLFMGDRDGRLLRVSEPIEALVADDNLIVHRDLLREPAVRRTVDALTLLYKRAGPSLSGHRALAQSA